MIDNAETIKYNLDVVNTMISLVERRIRTSENLMSAINSDYEYDTATGYKLNQDKLDEAKANHEMLSNLLVYRSQLLNYALGNGSEPTLQAATGFEF